MPPARTESLYPGVALDTNHQAREAGGALSERSRSAGRDYPIRLQPRFVHDHHFFSGPPRGRGPLRKGGVMPELRPLPPRPSMEYLRKDAKTLHRRLRAGDPEALARARAQHPGIGAAHPDKILLANAQLVIAREHGFTSWPRLVHYVDDLERQQHALTQLHGGPGLYEAHARSLLGDHHARRTWAGRALAAYVPRFNELRVDEVLSNAVTEDDAHLVVARMHGAPCWGVLLERLEGNARTRPGDWEADPMRDVVEAMAAADLSALERVVVTHPGLLRPSRNDLSAGRTLVWIALGQERRLGSAAMRPIMDWLAERGFDRQRELNTRLCGHGGMRPEEVRSLLDQGADPNWIAPNGIPVLEHALLRYQNGNAVDVLAAHAVPRRALWIAAGLGDLDGVRRWLDHGGKPIAATRRLRPDFIAVAGPVAMTPLPDADDEELLVETLLVAMFNGRSGIIEYLASRGAPVNSLVYGVPLINLAVANGMTAAVEGLLRAGADLDLCGRFFGDQEQSARELVRGLLEQQPESADYRRIVALCGMDPDAILAERDTRMMPPPRLDPSMEQALSLAREDAARLGQLDVRPENLLIGLLRGGGPPLHILKDLGRLDVDRFHAQLGDRLSPTEGNAGAPDVPMHVDANAVVEAAVAFAIERRHDVVWGHHLLYALTRDERGPVAQFLAGYGVSATTINAALEGF